MDRIIIIDDSGIRSDLEVFLKANKGHIRLDSNLRELAQGNNPLIREIISRYEEKYKLRFKTKDSLYFFRVNEVVAIAATGTGITVYLNGKEALSLEGGMEIFSGDYLNYPFLRIHEQHIVNLNYIKEIKASPPHVVMEDGRKIPVSGSFTDHFQKGMGASG